MWENTSASATPLKELKIKPDITLYDNANGKCLPHIIGAFIELKRKDHIQDSDAKEQLCSNIVYYMLTYHRFFIQLLFCNLIPNRTNFWGAISDGVEIQFYHFIMPAKYPSNDGAMRDCRYKRSHTMPLFSDGAAGEGLIALFSFGMKIPTFQGEHGTYTLLRYLGSGMSANVFETQTEDKESAVIKIFFQENEKYQIEYNNELRNHQILQKAPLDDHKFLSTIIDHSKAASSSASSETKNEPLFLVTSPLGKPFEKKTNNPFTFPSRSCLLFITKALYQLHKHNIVHFDIKPENMFMKMEGENVVSIFFFNFCFFLL